jgi:demethylmenaquinone methyltransferase / 2-methoxy-6-polyprenyl-1,4-benzoquinol methylase
MTGFDVYGRGTYGEEGNMFRWGSAMQGRFPQGLFAPLAERYDLLAELLSFGQNSRWRRRMVDHIVSSAPRSVLDVATGTASVALELVARTDARVTGIDLTEEMIRRGKATVDRRNLQGRICVVLGRAERLPFRDATFDALSFTYLLRYVSDPAAVLKELARAIAPGGRMASLEFGVPPNRFWRLWWWLYTRVVLPGAGRLFGREWLRVGRFLGPSISEHYNRYPLEWHVRAWEDAGMVEVGCVRMSLGGGLVMWGTKSPG